MQKSFVMNRQCAETLGDSCMPMPTQPAAAAEYATVLADLEVRATVKGIIRAGCFGLSVDEGTDISVS